MSTDVEWLQEALEYSPETGLLVWKISPCPHVAAGSVAGYEDRDGYWRLKSHGRQYSAHRVAWLLMTGAWPVAEIDHRNLNKSDNRWVNLREANRTQNMANRRNRGKFPKGVSLHRCGRFQAMIRKNGKKRHLGMFQSAEEASDAYAAAAIEHFGEFARIE